MLHNKPHLARAVFVTGVLGATLTALLAAQTKDEKRSADASKKDPVEVEKEKIKGKWLIVSLELDGVPTPKPKEEEKRTALFTAQRWKTYQGVAFNYELDPTTNPKAMTLQTVDETKKTLLGIYELGGDDLKICFCVADYITPGKQERPTAFSTKTGSKKMLFVLRRQNP